MNEEIDLDKIDDVLDEISEEQEEDGDVEDSKEEVDTGDLVGFRLNCGVLMNILKHLKSSGKTAAGDNVDYVEDCILRVEENILWSICVDNNYGLFSYAKVKVDNDRDHNLDTYQTGEIPINIDRLLQFLNRYSGSDILEYLYEGGVMVIRKTRPDLDNPIKVEAFVPSIRKDSVRNDMFYNVFGKYKQTKSERHRKMLSFVKKYKSPCVIKSNNTAVLYDGTILDNFVEVSCDQLKDVVRDGDLFDNRLYPFTVNNNVINVTAKPLEKSDHSKFSRDLYVKQINLKGDFITTYPSQFNAAVTSTRGHVMLFFGNNKPLLLYKSSDKDYGIDMGYIVSNVKSKVKIKSK